MNNKEISEDNNHAKTVGIMTVGFRYLMSNYGSFFQHYALRHLLRSFGYTSFRIKHPNEKAGIREILYTFLQQYFYAPLREFVNSGNIRCINPIIIWAKIAKEIKFRRTYNKMRQECSAKYIKNLDAINMIGLVGSDQVWGYTSSYVFMDFLSPNIRRVAYAASSDWNRIAKNKEWLLVAENELVKFSAVSLRERAGIELLSSTIPKLPYNIFHAIDPVLMLKDVFVTEVSSKKNIFSQKTLLCYVVNSSENASFPLGKYKLVADKLGLQLKVIECQCGWGRFPRKYLIVPSPAEFLQCFHDAAFIITNSFHGTLFSIIFHKRFVTVEQMDTVCSNQNQRQSEILNVLKLNRVVNLSESVDSVVDILKQDIDWSVPDKFLEEWSERSIAWLRENI